MEYTPIIFSKKKLLQEMRERYKTYNDHYQKEFLKKDGIKLNKEINSLIEDYKNSVKNSYDDEFIVLVVNCLF